MKNTKLKKSVINSRIIIGVTIAMFTMMFVSCNSPAEKVKEAKDNVVEAKQELSVAEQEHIAEVKLFKAETNKSITAYEKQIAEINKEIATSNKKLKAGYEKQISLLEQKSMKLKDKMSNYTADKKEDWVSFKNEFYNDMNELGLALKNFTVEK
jgi:septal ring factor EnvC (AmiA/AmiB activator)